MHGYRFGQQVVLLAPLAGGCAAGTASSCAHACPQHRRTNDSDTGVVRRRDRKQVAVPQGLNVADHLRPNDMHKGRTLIEDRGVQQKA
jgi:hypothetical protein